ncbi:hypothetical protein CKO18_10365 [Rhodoferax fermentans]|uniref:Uncharacterized protein n=1 Tax=Rhodoferax fermentans TaxID=28066 RepID=A0A1T1AMU3_RHOFE|nr:hypothetical protein [Rhodoferax fermentans]OOV05384.1 hypothetical protein RF819_00495 [Rhodoferax fermentans]
MRSVSDINDGIAQKILPVVDLVDAAWWMARDELCSKMTGTTVMWLSSATGRLTGAIGMAVAIGRTRPIAVLASGDFNAGKLTFADGNQQTRNDRLRETQSLKW